MYVDDAKKLKKELKNIGYEARQWWSLCDETDEAKHQDAIYF